MSKNESLGNEVIESLVYNSLMVLGMRFSFNRLLYLLKNMHLQVLIPTYSSTDKEIAVPNYPVVFTRMKI